MKQSDDEIQKSDARANEASSDDANAFVPIPLESLPLNVPLPHAVYLKISDQFILFRPKNDSLTTQRALALQGKQVSVVFVTNEQWGQFFKAMEIEEETAVLESAQESVVRLRHLLLAFGQELERRRQIGTLHLDKLRLLGQKLAMGISRDPTLARNLIRKYKDPGLYFVNHNVNVAIYSAAVAHKLNMPPAQVKLLAFAGLVHNVGNIFVPKEVLLKPSVLTREEWELVLHHPIKGAKLLELLKAPKEVVLTALQHHERIDGMGYPNHAPGDDIHMFAKICTIADVFDALTNRLPYQEALTPDEAVSRMLQMEGKFDPQILNMVVRTERGY